MTDIRFGSRRAFAGGLAGLAASIAIAKAADRGTSANPPYGCTITNFFKGGGEVLETYDCSNRTDIQFVTFALVTEYLQAEFYLNASTGSGLPIGDQGDGAGSVSGSHSVAFTTSAAAAYALEFGAEQRKHVEFLRQLIVSRFGRVPLSRPQIDFAGGFTSVAQQAGLVSAGQSFDAFANDTNFLLGAYLLEDIAVTSYHYLLSQVTNLANLDALSGLMGSEGYHAGIIRATLFGLGYAGATNALSFLRDTRDGSAGTPAQGNDHGVGTIGAPTIVVADGNAVAADRNTQQVAAILPFGNNGVTGMPFFPSGVMSPP